MWYVPTLNNPAYIASRGIGVESFLKEFTWISGPPFQMYSQKDLPEVPKDWVISGDADPEVRKCVLANVTHVEQPVDTVTHFISCSSSWTQLIRVIGWILRFKDLLLGLCRKRKEVEVKFSYPGSGKEQRRVLESKTKRIKKTLQVSRSLDKWVGGLINYCCVMKRNILSFCQESVLLLNLFYCIFYYTRRQVMVEEITCYPDCMRNIGFLARGLP